LFIHSLTEAYSSSGSEESDEIPLAPGPNLSLSPRPPVLEPHLGQVPILAWLPTATGTEPLLGWSL
jgi:hypothetical protein